MGYDLQVALAQMAQNQRLQVLLERQIELQSNYQLQQQDKEEKGRAVSRNLHNIAVPNSEEATLRPERWPEWDGN